MPVCTGRSRMMPLRTTAAWTLPQCRKWQIAPDNWQALPRLPVAINCWAPLLNKSVSVSAISPSRPRKTINNVVVFHGAVSPLVGCCLRQQQNQPEYGRQPSNRTKHQIQSYSLEPFPIGSGIMLPFPLLVLLHLFGLTEDTHLDGGRLHTLRLFYCGCLCW